MSSKIALITGASKGIGRSCVYQLAKLGFHIAIHYRSNEEEAKQLAEEVGNAKIFQADLSQEDQCHNLFKDVKKEYGTLDVLINNAGTTIDKLLPFTKPEDFDSLINTNLRPVFLLSKYASRLFMKQKRGSIVNITSIVGHKGNPGQSIYSATKSAITGLTISAAQELAPFGIRCNMVAPGFIDTQMTQALSEENSESLIQQIPLKRMGKPSEVASAVSFLVSEQASYITGTTIHVNGGLFCT